MTSRIAAPLVVLALLLSVGCSDGTTEPPPPPVSDVRFGAVLPDRALAGYELESPVRIRVLREDGSPASGVEVGWEVVSGGGHLSADTTVTGEDGHTEARWTLGPEPGIQRLRATAGAAALSTHLQAVSDAPVRLHLGIFDDGTVGEGRSFSFELEHALGERTPRSGDAVVEVLEGSGSGGPTVLLSADTVTWAEGLGEVTLGEDLVRPGPHRVRVRVPGTNLQASTDFRLHPGPPHGIIPERSWDDVAFEAGRTLPEPPVVRVLDRFENPVEGLPVETEVAGGGQVEDPEPVTDDVGRANPGHWTLGPEAGSQTLTFRAGEVERVLQVEASEARIPTELVPESAGERTAAPESSIPALSVRVLDQNGAPLQWVRTLWSVEEGDGQVRASATGSFGAQAEVLTDADGRAVLSAWRLGPEPGTERLRVHVPGTDLEEAFQARVTEIPSSDGFVLEGAYVVQAVQTPLQDVVLVEGRPAVLRAFVHGVDDADPDASAPALEAELLRGGSVVRSWALEPPSGELPTSAGVAEGSWSRSYNQWVGSEDIRSGTRLRVRFAAAGGDDSPSWWPSSDGLPLSTVALDPLQVRLVPIAVDALDRTADVDTGNAPTYLGTARALLPHPDLDAVVASPVAWSGPALEPDGTHWEDLLGELREVRSQSGGSGIWYGAVPLDYTQGVVGIGYIGLPVSLGWDRADLRAWILAHELGHNLGRRHAPCQVFPFDLNFPHPLGHIDAWGLDPNSLIPVPPDRCDIMGYGGPDNSWVSPYTFNGMAAFAARSGASPAAHAPGAGPWLRVWGTLGPDGPRLQPAYTTDRPEHLPPDTPTGEPVRIQLLDAGGGILLDMEAPTLAISHSDARGIGADIPLADFDEEALAGVRVTDARGRSTERWRSGGEGLPGAAAAPVDPAPRLESVPGGGWRLVWASRSAPLALVHDPVTGDFLGLGRDGGLELPPGSVTHEGVEVRFSDGVRSGPPVQVAPGDPR